MLLRGAVAAACRVLGSLRLPVAAAAAAAAGGGHSSLGTHLSAGCCLITTKPLGLDADVRAAAAAAAQAQLQQQLKLEQRQELEQQLELQQPAALAPRAARGARAAARVPPRLAELQRVLQQHGASFPATMAVLRGCSQAKLLLSPDAAAANLPRLQALFGPALADAMLAAAPDLLARNPEQLRSNFDALCAALGGGRPYGLQLVHKVPDLLKHNPSAVTRRMDDLLQLLPVDRPALRRLLLKAPVLAKLNPAKLSDVVDFLHQAAGMTPAEAYKVFMGWPVMASSRAELLRSRLIAVQQLLGADDAEMRRICRTFPCLVSRNPAQLQANIATLAQHLQLPWDQAISLMRRNPGLLSWNVSTLQHRMTRATLTLQLPPELSLTLLSHNRSLLSHHEALPERIEALRRALGVTEAELYPMLHGALTVLRLPPDMMAAKLECASRLCALHAPWAEQWAQHEPVAKIRTIQAGWACHWRAAFLLQTGQQGSTTFAHALRMSHVRFRELYPGFADWLDRYNLEVTSTAIPLPLEHCGDAAALAGPRTFTPVRPDASMGKRLHAGSLYERDSSAALGLQAAHASSSSSSSSSSASASASASGSASTGSVDDRSSSSGPVLQLPASPAGHLAAQLGVTLQQAEQLLEGCSSAGRLSRLGWQQRLAAISSLVVALGLSPQPPGSDASAAPMPDCSPQLHSMGAAQPAAQGQQLQPQQECERREQEPHAQQACVEFEPLPHARPVLEAAASSGHAAAVAAVSIASWLAPLSKRLYQPPRPPDAAAVALLVAHPRLLERKLLVPLCTGLAALAGASAEVRAQLVALGDAGLAACLMRGRARGLRCLQFLVATQQPVPWAFGVRALLVSDALGPGDAFAARYPGFEAWDEAMRAV